MIKKGCTALLGAYLLGKNFLPQGGLIRADSMLDNIRFFLIDVEWHADGIKRLSEKRPRVWRRRPPAAVALGRNGPPLVAKRPGCISTRSLLESHSVLNCHPCFSHPFPFKNLLRMFYILAVFCKYLMLYF